MLGKPYAGTMPSDDDLQAKGRALSSPVRLRILRYCLHQPRSNKEIAEHLELNPATSLHHVRTLLETGFLAAEEPRRGRRGAREVPYRATGLSWGTPVANVAPVLIETFIQEIDGLAPDELSVARLGVKLNDRHRKEMMDRLHAILEEYASHGPDEDGKPTSIMLAHHRDRTAE